MPFLFLPFLKEGDFLIYRILDVNGDYQFGKGLQHFTYGAYAVAQAIKTRLKLLEGEWFENTKGGLPLFQKIIGQSGTNIALELIDAIIKERIINTLNVTNIESYTHEYDSISRKYSFNCIANTPFGSITVSDIY